MRNCIRLETTLLNKPQLGLLPAWLAAAAMWCYADFILIPHQTIDATTNHRPRGNLSDLYPRWLGARELLLHGRNPYSASVTREIQAGYYGRALDPSRASDPKDQQGFAYPVYVVFLLAATIHWPFAVVQAAFRWVLVVLLIASVPLWQRALSWQISPTSTLIWITLVLGSFPAVQGIKLQQLTLLVCALLAASVASLAGGHLRLAGILLALGTIKPQLAGIVAPWLLLWTASDWRARRRLAWSFGLTMLALVAGGEVLLPGWIGQFRAAVSAYWGYTGGGRSLLDMALMPTWGRVASAIVVLLVAGFCWRMRLEPAHSDRFAWTLAVVFTATLVVIPTFAPYNQILLLPALMMIVRAGCSLWRQGGRGRFLLTLTGIAVLWPWLSALILDALLLVLPRSTIEATWALPLWTSLALPFPVAATVALCASRLARASSFVTTHA